MSAHEPLAAVHRLPTDHDAPRVARDAAAEMLVRLGCGDDRAEDLALVVSELVTNTVVHGPDAELELRFVCTQDTIRVEVRDEGVEPFQWPDVRVDGHWGLDLVRIFSDRSGILREPSTCVWCELDVDGVAAG